MKKNSIPSWLKLDNAAILYPSTLSKKYASMFRMTVTLKEKVDKDILESALNNVIKRFPSFRYRLKNGFFWWYFKYNEGIPPIQNDYNNPMLRMNFKNNRYFMFRVRCFDRRIAIEYFHALTDGNGGISFLLTLVGEYLHIKENISIPYNDLILNPNDIPKKNDYSDNFYKFSRGIKSLEKEKGAYHYKGTKLEAHMLHIISGIIPIDNIKSLCKTYSCTITEFIVSIMLLSLQEMQEKEGKKKKKSIKVSIPLNLRKYYSTKTIRNFSSYVNVGVETRYGHYSLEEIIKEVQAQMVIKLNEKKINAKFSSNVKLESNIFVRLIPMFIKKHLISIVERFIGDRLFTIAFSNLGLISIPKNMNKYLDELGFVLGKSRKNPGSVACIGFNGNLYISFSKTIEETDFERLFFTNLVEMGIPVEIESNLGGD